MKRSSTILLVFALAILASCGGGSGGSDYTTNPPPPPPPPSGDVSVYVWSTYYNPDTVKVTAGKSVTWDWQYAAGTDHDVVLDDGSVDSGVMTSGTFKHTFGTPGTYAYHCTRHPMKGVVVVQ
ncbi:MAG TPA: plastocyanin/azurin family copper-binding protein [Gemmatimonadaceae bacterium]